MPTVFKNVKSRNVGATPVAIGSYTVAAATTAVVTGLTVANVTASTTIKVSVSVYDSVNDYFLVKGLELVPGASVPIVGIDRHTLNTGESIRVLSDTATSADAVLSVMERS